MKKVEKPDQLKDPPEQASEKSNNLKDAESKSAEIIQQINQVNLQQIQQDIHIHPENQGFPYQYLAAMEKARPGTVKDLTELHLKEIRLAQETTKFLL